MGEPTLTVMPPGPQSGNQLLGPRSSCGGEDLSFGRDPLGIGRAVDRVRAWCERAELPPLARRIVDTDVLMGVALTYLASQRARTGAQPSVQVIDTAALAEIGLILRLARMELLDIQPDGAKHELLALLDTEARCIQEVLGAQYGKLGPEAEALILGWDSRCSCELSLGILGCTEPERRVEQVRSFLLHNFSEASRMAAGGELPAAEAISFGRLVAELLFASLHRVAAGAPMADHLAQRGRYAPFFPLLRAKLYELERASENGCYELLRTFLDEPGRPVALEPLAPPPPLRWDPELAPVVELLRSDLSLGGSALAEDIARTYAEPKGKLMRASLTLSFAQMVGCPSATALPFAAAIEGLHQASLLIDDLIDQTQLRHGLPTVAQRHGSKAALLLGHYIMSQATARLYPMHRRGWRMLQRALFVMLDGQRREGQAGVVPTRRVYLQTIQEKTAYLLATGCEIGVAAGRGSRAQERAAHVTGLRLGMAFQIVDDYLDYFGTPAFGKQIGGDFEAGVVTLPILLLLARMPAETQAIHERLLRRAPGDLDWLIAKMRELGVDREVLDNAHYYAQLAQSSLRSFAPSEARARVEQVADQIIARQR